MSMIPWLALVIPAVFVLLGSVFALKNVSLRRQGCGCAQWPVASGRILEADQQISQAGQLLHRVLFAAALVIIASTYARAGTGPCKPDSFNGLTCGDGPGAARVIAGTISPSKKMAFAWREPGKSPTEEPDIYQVESLLLWLHDGTVLAISRGDYWDTGTVRANRYDFHAIWSPNSRFVIELLDFRWSTQALRLYSLSERGEPILSLDLKPIVELAVRKELRKTVKDEASYAFELQGDNSGEPPHLTIDNNGKMKARIEMQVPKEEKPTVYVDITLQIRQHEGALQARPVSIRKSNGTN